MSNGAMIRSAYDTETSDTPLWSEPSLDPRQPHIVQAAWVTFDAEGQETDSYSAIVRQDGWVSSPEALAVHGITHERAMDEGIPEKDVVDRWLDAHQSVDLRIAHNPHFDDRILKIAMLRYGRKREFVDRVLGRPKYDTCRFATKIMNLPPSDKMAAAKMKMAKSAKLIECASHFFDVGPDGAHDALWDARMCGRLYWHLQSLQKPTPT